LCGTCLFPFCCCVRLILHPKHKHARKKFYPKPLRPPPPPPPPELPPPEKLLWLELEEDELQLLPPLLPDRKLVRLGLELGLLATNEVAVVFNIEKKLALTLLSEVNAPLAA
jgi:hypothetical protein